jgi:hypothetical protein
MAQRHALTAADLKMYINNKPFGIATSFEVRMSAGRTPIYGIDSGEPQELAESQYKVTGRINFIKVKLDGGIERRGLVALPHNYKLEKYITINLLDRQFDSSVFFADKAQVISHGFSVDRGIVKGFLEFEAIGYVADNIE